MRQHCFAATAWVRRPPQATSTPLRYGNYVGDGDRAGGGRDENDRDGYDGSNGDEGDDAGGACIC